MKAPKTDIYSPSESLTESLTESLIVSYEKQYSKKGTRSRDGSRKGIVYTPPKIADLLAHNLQLEKSTTNTITVLDPACGGGMLLIAVLRKAALLCYFNNATSAAEFIKNSLFGIDRDSKAVEITKASLLSELNALYPNSQNKNVLLSKTWRNNFASGNTLISKKDTFTQFDSISLKTLFPQIFNKGGFSHIIMNPPYGLSRGDQIAPSELTALKILYKDVLSGKPNKYTLFILRSLKLLQLEGTLSAIIPNSWLGIRSTEKFRRVLIDNNYISKIEVLSSNPFKERGVETTILTCSKKNNNSIAISTLDKRFIEERKTTLPYRVITSRNQYEIPTNWNEDTRELHSWYKRSSVPLLESDLGLVPLITTQIYARGKGSPPQDEMTVKTHPLHSRKKLQSPSQFKYVKGKDISQYQVSWSGEYVQYDKRVAEYQPISRYTCPRILIREITGKNDKLFIACYTEEPFLYNKSVLHIIPDICREKKSADMQAELEPLRVNLLALTALINSKYGSEYLKYFGKKTQRGLFPKVVNQDLKNLPIPHKFHEMKFELSEYSKLLHQRYNKKTEVLLNTYLYKELFSLNR